MVDASRRAVQLSAPMYRDDLDAAQSRIAALEGDLEAARADPVDAWVTQLEAERAKVAGEFEAAGRRERAMIPRLLWIGVVLGVVLAAVMAAGTWHSPAWSVGRVVGTGLSCGFLPVFMAFALWMAKRRGTYGTKEPMRHEERLRELDLRLGEARARAAERGTGVRVDVEEVNADDGANDHCARRSGA